MNTIPAVFKVVPTTQQYDWGKKGRSSSVAQFADAYNIKIDDGSPYAEVQYTYVLSKPLN
jgi:mannose-6-phosphate isomerase